MDIYAVFDLALVVVAIFVYFKTKSRESILLLVFFAMSGSMSAITYELSDYFAVNLRPAWIGFFCAAAVLFGHISNNARVKLGYAVHLGFLGLDLLHGISLIYPILIAITYLYQLWVAYNEWLVDFRSGDSISESSFNYTSSSDG